MSEVLLEVVDGMKKCHSPPGPSPNFELGKVPVEKECQADCHVTTHAFMASLSHRAKETASRVFHAGRCDIAASFTKLGRLEMKTSEACHKGFVIFDQGEGKNRVILHPLWLNMCPVFHQALQCSFNRGAGNYVDMLGIPQENFLEVVFGSKLSADPACSMVGKVSALQVQHIMASDKRMGCTLFGFPRSSQALGLNDDSKRMSLSYKENFREELPLEFRENTEEINALLSSDYGDNYNDEDELTSTGHSPSVASSNNNNHANSNISKKRKLDHLTQEEADDADSGPGIAESVPGPESQHHHPPIKDGSLLFSSAPVASAVKGPLLHASRSCGTLEGGLHKSSKRLKVRNMVQELKHVVPGGEGLDMAGMLGRTIEYVKCLQRRVEVTRGHIWG